MNATISKTLIPFKTRFVMVSPSAFYSSSAAGVAAFDDFGIDL
jgi:hypothetical protein